MWTKSVESDNFSIDTAAAQKIPGTGSGQRGNGRPNGSTLYGSGVF